MRLQKLSRNISVLPARMSPFCVCSRSKVSAPAYSSPQRPTQVLSANEEKALAFIFRLKAGFQFFAQQSAFAVVFGVPLSTILLFAGNIEKGISVGFASVVVHAFSTYLGIQLFKKSVQENKTALLTLSTHPARPEVIIEQASKFLEKVSGTPAYKMHMLFFDNIFSRFILRCFLFQHLRLNALRIPALFQPFET